MDVPKTSSPGMVAAAPSGEAGVEVSVVVPTYLRLRLLCRCLKALARQDRDPSSYEIIVVDDARSDATRAALAGFSGRLQDKSKIRPKIRYIRPPLGTRGPAAARNAGWRAARGAVVAFTDDDTIPLPGWLGEGLRALRGADATAAAGRVVVPLPLPPKRPTDWQRNTAGLDGAEFVTANCFIRRHALAAAGGFDERFTSAWREDSDLYFTLLEQRGKVVAAPAAIVVHPARPAPRGISLAQHRKLFFDALLYKKHRQLYRKKIAAAPPLRYYLTVAAAVSALAALPAGQVEIAALCAVIWLALTVQLAVRRLRGTSRAWRDRLDMVLTSIAIPFAAVYWRVAGALHFRVLFA
jgi:hypothetical protein